MNTCKTSKSKSIKIAGKYYARIPYGAERYQWDSNVPCHDCQAHCGEFHAPGCDAEECPKCGEQAISCGCNEEHVDDDNHAYRNN